MLTALFCHDILKIKLRRACGVKYSYKGGKMKFIKKLFNNFSYSGKMIRLMWRNDKVYLFFVLLDIAVYSCIPLINLPIVQKSIEMLEARAEFHEYAAVVMALIAVNLMLQCMHNYLTYKRDLHGNVISLALYKGLFEKTLALDYEMLLDKDVQEKRELAEKLVWDGRFSKIATNFHNFLSNMIILFGLIAVLSRVDVIVLALSLMIVMINTVVTRYRNKYRRSIDIDMNPISRRIKYFTNIGSSFSFIKEIKTYGMGGHLLDRYNTLQGKLYEGTDKAIRLSLAGYIISHIMNFLLEALGYTYLGFRVLVRNNLSIADFSMFFAAIYSFSSSVGSIIGTFENMSANGVYLQDYFDFLDLETMKDSIEGKPFKLPEGGEYSFVFDNVSYKYPHQEDYALRNVSLEIRNNEKVAIVGENGAGKTTLIMLLMRVVTPVEGRILLNGIDILDYGEDEYRKLFSTVFQDYKLFSFSIQDNITALGDADPSLVTCAIKRAGLEQKIASLNKGVHTYIDKLYDNEGVVLSGGESQRLAIARALYKNAPIYVLDEPTAALDPRIEHEIYTKFRDITEGKTAFYITHRLASTHFCDRIIVLKDGGVVEFGCHRELMDKNGYYAELYNMQAQYYAEGEG